MQVFLRVPRFHTLCSPGFIWLRARNLAKNFGPRPLICSSSWFWMPPLSCLYPWWWGLSLSRLQAVRSLRLPVLRSVDAAVVLSLPCRSIWKASLFSIGRCDSLSPLSVFSLDSLCLVTRETQIASTSRSVRQSPAWGTVPDDWSSLQLGPGHGCSPGGALETAWSHVAAPGRGLVRRNKPPDYPAQCPACFHLLDVGELGTEEPRRGES